MVNSDLTFNCGEFKPGKRPRKEPPVPPKTPPKSVPKKKVCCPKPPDKLPAESWTCICEKNCPDNFFPNSCADANSRKCVREDSVKRGTPRGKSYLSKSECEKFAFHEAPCWICSVKCVSRQINCPPPFQNRVARIKRDCAHCLPVAFPNRVECPYNSITQCRPLCTDTVFGCPDVQPDPVNPVQPPPRGPITGPRTPSPVEPPNSPGKLWRCTHQKVYCQNSQNIGWKVNCAVCTDADLKNPIIKPKCRFKSETECKSNIKQGNFGQKTVGDCEEIPCPVEVPSSPIRDFRPPDKLPIVEQSPVGERDIENRVNNPIVGDRSEFPDSAQDPNNNDPQSSNFNPGLNTQNLRTGFGGLGSGGGAIPPNTSLVDRINKIQVINISELASKSNVSQDINDSSLYHPKYNFFTWPTSQEEFELVENNKFRNIFKDYIPKEIKYILDHIDTSGPWKEFPLSQVTPLMLEASIDNNLLEAFDNIHTVGGFPIERTYFLNAIYRWMVYNRLSEFDARYYFDLAKKQAQDTLLVFEKSNNTNIDQRAALGVIAEEAEYVNPDKHSDLAKQQLLRERVLNEDIESSLPVEVLVDNVVYPLALVNAGLAINVENPGVPVEPGAPETTTYIPLGDGYGYYFSVQLDTLATVPLQTSTAIANAYYISPETREKALELFNVREDRRLTVSSVANKSEFDALYTTGTSNTSALYFKLNLATVGDIDQTDSFINEVSATYSLLTDIDEINAHTKNYGFGMMRVNVDFRDPFYVYAQESQTVELQQKDITFRSFVPARSSNEAILVRTLPFGLLLVPGQGSKHNPFNQHSDIVRFKEGVTRELVVEPDIDRSLDDQYIPQLDEKFTLTELGTPYIGLVEVSAADAQNIFYQFSTSSLHLSGTYHSNGSYSSVPAVIRERSGMGNLVRLIEDVIKSKYTITNDTLTWWDIFRRLTFTEYARLVYESPKSIFAGIEKGWRGVKVRDVLNRLVEGETGIGAVTDESVVDNIILLESHRNNPTLL